MSPKDLKKLIENIEIEKCVLFIGPELENTENNETPQNFFLRDLQKNNPELILKYHENDNFLIFKDKSAITRLSNEIDNFYKNQIFAKNLLAKISRIPFHLIISVNPDTSLVKILSNT